MSAAIQEYQARLNVTLKEIVSFFAQDEKIEPRSVEILNEYVEKHLTSEFLLLAESYGRSMAFINHDELVNILVNAWMQLLDGYALEKKVTLKRIRILKEDKKTDPAFLARQEQILLELEEKRARTLVNSMRLKAMKTFSIQDFKNAEFDFVKAYGEKLKQDAEAKALLIGSKENIPKDKRKAK